MDQLLGGFRDALTVATVFYVGLGLFIGYAIGVLPGLNRGTALAVTIPITFYMTPLAAIAFLVGISKGSASGGAVSAILLNTPGEPSSVATCLDGYPLARQGKAKKAMKAALVASVLGDLLGTVVLIAVAEPLAAVALKIGPIELTTILIFSLTFIAGLSGGSLLKGVISGALGVFVACAGLDVETAQPRLTFGLIELQDGVPLLAVGIGMLALSEMLIQLDEHHSPGASTDLMRLTKHPDDARLTGGDLRLTGMPMLQGSFIGIVVGILPGLGASVASFLSYAAAKRSSRMPELFGKGALEGVAAAEAADNAVVPASLIPLFAIGIPGSVAAAILIGAFMIHGVTPGPLMFSQHGELVYGIYAAMLIASFLMLAIGWYGLKLFALLTRLPETVVVPSVVFLCVVGTFFEGGSMFGVYLMLLFALLGYFLKKLDFSFVTFLIGFIIGPALELAMRQALIISGRNPLAMLDHPIALAFLGFSAIAVWRLGFSRPRSPT